MSVCRVSTTEGRRLLAAQRAPSKYHAIRTTVDGWTFDSRREAARYVALLRLGAAGILRDLELQPRFPLRARINDDVRRGGYSDVIGVYVADFRYQARVGEGWTDVIEDVKGVRTPVYRLKKKHVEAQYGIQIREV